VLSLVIPAYNEALRLPATLRRVREYLDEAGEDYEVIVVDDGSTDDTEAVVREWTKRVARPVHYVKQDNRGAYGARNTGLDRARSDYVAFFDSDDLWLPHHLARCVEALSRAADVDWVFAACRCIDPAGAVVQPTTFETPAGPRPFRALKTRAVGDLHIIDDARIVACQLTHGLYAGLQNSVIRRRVFDGHRFWQESRVVDDVMFLLRALVRGVRLAYLPDVHVIYRIHEGNSSASSIASNRDSLARIRRESIDGLERLDRELAFKPDEKRALRRTLSRHYFWDLGYVCYWEGGDAASAFEAFRHGLRLNPTDYRMWKTYAACLIRSKYRQLSAPPVADPR
jgi:glycosyltransferase involved in cell wall biosynthesis